MKKLISIDSSATYGVHQSVFDDRGIRSVRVPFDKRTENCRSLCHEFGLVGHVGYLGERLVNCVITAAAA
jgi:hypothetical protein